MTWVHKMMFLGMALSAANCVGVKPYEKEYLLSPLMDDAELQSLSSDFRGMCVAPFEHLSGSGVGGAAGSACPTCGG